MAKIVEEGFIQRALREAREKLQQNRADAVVKIVVDLSRNPGALTEEAKAFIKDVKAMTNAQLDDDEFYDAIKARGVGLLAGASASTEMGKRATTFR